VVVVGEAEAAGAPNDNGAAGVTVVWPSWKAGGAVVVAAAVVEAAGAAPNDGRVDADVAGAPNPDSPLKPVAWLKVGSVEAVVAVGWLKAKPPAAGAVDVAAG
jgi:hypothetical protein